MSIYAAYARNSELSDEQLVSGFHAGESGCLDELLVRYRLSARARARTYFVRGGDADDIEQEGLIGLYKAVRDYRPEHDVSFRTFAELCITRHVLSAVQSAGSRKHQPLNSYVSLSSSDMHSDHFECRSRDASTKALSADPSQYIVEKERVFSLWECITQALSAMEIKIFQLYQDGKSYQEIGEQLGYQVKAIDNALQRIKKKLSAIRPSIAELQ